MTKQQKGLQKAYGASATRNYVSASRGARDSATLNYVSANKVQHKVNTPKNKCKCDNDDIEHDYLAYTSLTPASSLLMDSINYRALQSKYSEL